MKTFQIKLSSVYVFMVLMLVAGLPASILLISSIRDNINSTTIFWVFFGALAASYLFSRRMSTAMTSWEVTEKELRILWQKKMFFHNRPDYIINWEDIEAYQYRRDRAFDLFKIKLKSGRFIRFWHNTDFTKDDFQSFINYFEERVIKHNEAEIIK